MKRSNRGITFAPPYYLVVRQVVRISPSAMYQAWDMGM